MNSKQVLINKNNAYWSDYLKGCTQNDIVKPTNTIEKKNNYYW
ncbi:MULTISPECIES: hypothetical protein [Cysteiniphilum]|nr:MULTISPECIES: hypothetical protein [Cysteiniphilum]